MAGRAVQQTWLVTCGASGPRRQTGELVRWIEPAYVPGNLGI